MTAQDSRLNAAAVKHMPSLPWLIWFNFNWGAEWQNEAVCTGKSDRVKRKLYKVLMLPYSTRQRQMWCAENKGQITMLSISNYSSMNKACQVVSVLTKVMTPKFQSQINKKKIKNHEKKKRVQLHLFIFEALVASGS